MFDLVDHFVKTDSQFAHLVIALGQAHALFEVAKGYRLGGVPHVPQRTEQQVGEEKDSCTANADNNDCRYDYHYHQTVKDSSIACQDSLRQCSQSIIIELCGYRAVYKAVENEQENNEERNKDERDLPAQVKKWAQPSVDTLFPLWNCVHLHFGSTICTGWSTGC